MAIIDNGICYVEDVLVQSQAMSWTVQTTIYRNIYILVSLAQWHLVT